MERIVWFGSNICDKFENETFKGPIGKFIDDKLLKFNTEVKYDNDMQIIDINDRKCLRMMKWNITSWVLIQMKTTEWKKITQISKHPVKWTVNESHNKTNRTVTATLSHSFKRTINSIIPIEGNKLKVMTEYQ